MHAGVPGWGGQAICLGLAWTWMAQQWDPGESGVALS